MKITEIYYSLQGEGKLTGTPAVLIRIAGCPLKCIYCDSQHALNEEDAEEMSIKQITREVAKYPCTHIILTGGEPLKDNQILPLINELKKLGKHITIETSALKFIPGLKFDLISISPKLSNSGKYAAKYRVINKYMKIGDYQLKFVIDKPEDIEEVNQFIAKLDNPGKENILLMPQARTREQLLGKAPMVADLCKKTGYSFSNRLHIMLWSDKPST